MEQSQSTNTSQSKSPTKKYKHVESKVKANLKSQKKAIERRQTLEREESILLGRKSGKESLSPIKRVELNENLQRVVDEQSEEAILALIQEKQNQVQEMKSQIEELQKRLDSASEESKSFQDFVIKEESKVQLNKKSKTVHVHADEDIVFKQKLYKTQQFKPSPKKSVPKTSTAQIQKAQVQNSSRVLNKAFSGQRIQATPTKSKSLNLYDKYIHSISEKKLHPILLHKDALQKQTTLEKLKIQVEEKQTESLSSTIQIPTEQPESNLQNQNDVQSLTLEQTTKVQEKSTNSNQTTEKYWIETELGNLPFTSYSNNQSLAQDSSTLKQIVDQEFDLHEPVFLENVQNNKFTANQVVYSIQQSTYFKIVKELPCQDELIKEYLCKLFKNSATESIKMCADDLTTQIRVLVCLDTGCERDQTSYAELEVDISGKICEEFRNLLGKEGSVIYNGAVVDESDTFVSKSIDQLKGKFLFVLGQNKINRTLIWRRLYKKKSQEWFTGPDCTDAMKFIAQKKVAIHGFLWSEECKNQEFTLMCSFRVNEEQFCEEFEFAANSEHSEFCPNTEDKFHFFQFKDVQQPVVNIDEGGIFEIKSRIIQNDKKFKVYQAEEANNLPVPCPDQEQVFKTESSDQDGNGTGIIQGMYYALLYTLS